MGHVSHVQLEQLFEAVLRLLLRPTVAKGYSHVAIKLSPWGIAEIPLFLKHAPAAKHFLMTRNVKSSVKVLHQFCYYTPHLL